MKTVYISGYRNSAGVAVYVCDKEGEVSFTPYEFETAEAARIIALKAAKYYPLWSEIFVKEVVY